MKLLLDTHTAVWLLEGDRNLGRKARARCDAALAGGDVAICSVSIYELGVLVVRKRLESLRPLADWRHAIRSIGISECVLDGELAARAAHLEAFHFDPADRIIVATAQAHGRALVTADRQILGWNGRLELVDAHR